ncbi:hypothetical protein [Nocardia vaccinii]|nr:hypothetical protein [Nocardia vaccinii]
MSEVASEPERRHSRHTAAPRVGEARVVREFASARWVPELAGPRYDGVEW